MLRALNLNNSVTPKTLANFQMVNTLILNYYSITRTRMYIQMKHEKADEISSIHCTIHCTIQAVSMTQQA